MSAVFLFSKLLRELFAFFYYGIVFYFRLIGSLYFSLNSIKTLL